MPSVLGVEGVAGLVIVDHQGSNKDRLVDVTQQEVRQAKELPTGSARIDSRGKVHALGAPRCPRNCQTTCDTRSQT